MNILQLHLARNGNGIPDSAKTYPVQEYRMGKTDKTWLIKGIAVNASYEVLRFAGGTLMVVLCAGMFSYLRHRTVDWWGLVLLGSVTGLVWLAILLLKQNAPTSAPAVGVESLEHTIFTAQQMKVFQLVHDLIVFRKDIGEPPLIDWNSFDTTTPEGDAAFLAALNGEHRKWHLKLEGTYESQFAFRVKEVYQEFKRDGFNQDALCHFTERINDWAELNILIDRLTALAHQLDGIYLQVKEDKDTL